MKAPTMTRYKKIKNKSSRRHTTRVLYWVRLKVWFMAQFINLPWKKWGHLNQIFIWPSRMDGAKRNMRNAWFNWKCNYSSSSKQFSVSKIFSSDFRFGKSRRFQTETYPACEHTVHKLYVVTCKHLLNPFISNIPQPQR